jgi:hypothetical protein
MELGKKLGSQRVVCNQNNFLCVFVFRFLKYDSELSSNPKLHTNDDKSFGHINAVHFLQHTRSQAMVIVPT